MKLTFVKRGNVAVPVDESWSKIKEEEVFTAEVRRIRCPGFHRRLWVMVRIAWGNDPEGGQFPNVEKYMKFLLFMTGHFTIRETLEGAYAEVDSISFESMDQDAIKGVYDSLLDYIIKRLGTTNEDFVNEIMKYA